MFERVVLSSSTLVSIDVFERKIGRDRNEGTASPEL